MARPTKRDQINKRISLGVSKMTPENINKLKEAFAIDSSIEESCYYTGIRTQTYYNWIKNNPELFDEFEALRQKPILKARQEVIKGLENDKHFAFAYLKSKRPNEFRGDKVVEINTPGEPNLPPNDAITPEMEKLTKEYEENMRKAIRNAWENKK